MTTKATAAEPQIVRALTSFVGGLGKVLIQVPEGQNWAADDPFVKKYPEFFGPLTFQRSTPRIEQATAGPGEKRGA
jgi:hypothetical protein